MKEALDKGLISREELELAAKRLLGVFLKLE